MSAKEFRLLVVCSAAVIAALLIVGAVSHGVIRHVVQTSPLWIAIALAARRSPISKWAALPCFVFWLVLMTFIWLYLLGWARIITGTFSPTEIAMTVVVGVASFTAIGAGFRMRSGIIGLRAAVIVVIVGALQLIALRLSLLPAIAHR